MLSLLAVVCLVFAPATPSPQAAAGAQLEAVTAALGRGDAARAAGYFDQTVEVVLPGLEDILARDAAERALASFFEQHPARAFARVHGGTSAGREGAYVIGTLTSAAGTTFRVYVYASGAGDVAVQELRIENE